MTANEDQGRIKEHAGGSITEYENKPIPVFLKLTYLGFSIFGLAYLFLFQAGEVAHSTRGALVQEFNNSVKDLPGTGWIVFLGVILAAFVVALWAFAFSSAGSEE